MGVEWNNAYKIFSAWPSVTSTKRFTLLLKYSYQQEKREAIRDFGKDKDSCQEMSNVKSKQIKLQHDFSKQSTIKWQTENSFDLEDWIFSPVSAMSLVI